jgi:hypothetical protein
MPVALRLELAPTFRACLEQGAKLGALRCGLSRA